MYSRPRPLPYPPTRITSSFRSRQVVTHQNQLNEKTLLLLLDNLQRKLLERRGQQTTLVVHGGIVAVLAHKCRAVTTDIDYIDRVLPEELDLPMKKPGFSFGAFMKKVSRIFSGKKKPDTRTILKECIAEVAAEFNSRYSNPLIVLEHDWMNSAADVALPWHLDRDCYMVDPLVTSAVRDAEAHGRALYDSPGLRLIGITPSWIFALKLQRFSIMDEDDIVCLLAKDGACAKYSEDDFAQMVERRLRVDCPVMDYDHYPERAMSEWRTRLRECVRKARYEIAMERRMSR
ncbi:uncharacterized protein FOMMEDRAFT_17113 [Fomitiporia mediterranea MF3/22]|uniref:uncharacterized protein n=1 Tax=Fomitiporia mediterranea (strain MF3/22) TaxID=694068 RepID=UPI00044093F5|nr:uncharacterized protein FOMMEDRAFT_17113 [Fomitiporia mediterranea MF3/22]EJD06615.1 hypothetical protein FOMMEDRAFT_17113 [Fomitiporia mediterranea MF3/22]